VPKTGFLNVKAKISIEDKEEIIKKKEAFVTIFYNNQERTTKVIDKNMNP